MDNCYCNYYHGGETPKAAVIGGEPFEISR